MKRLLLISNSTNPGEPYLGWPRPYITSFLAGTGVKNILFIPYAGVNLSPEGLEKSYDIYEQRVQAVFKELGYGIYSIHHEQDPVEAVRKAEAIAVGGGNTFYLVYMMHKMKLVDVIRDRANDGMHYMGWSAGANVACPTLRTTNDMPIVQPDSFRTCDLVPFQINPHYLDANPEGHGGETRQQRIEEFLAVNRDITVIGLRESSLIQVEGDKYELKGKRPMRVFRYGLEPVETVSFDY
ncbi:MAG TPA: dipeptidase PepE [Bacteroidales bacterium]|jgi:dipeptidase E|nr:dipeptidase PepE [Bacteroidales bacterium]MDX9907024.1 dipeptidase PepE [Bacteroidales bacterium]HNQ83703.1 dipeptidase PepE [Bacteroidales bacterium]HOX77438.1 dipeptidase PepE [Bacteroidales bacterium]